MDIFRPGENCWRVERAEYASIVVDYGNYYRDLRESILKAKKSIFMLGWDIDSRIRLLRGKDAEGKGQTTFFDLVTTVARENPALQIFLNKWDHSIFFTRQREPSWLEKWQSAGLPNIHVCLDDKLPLAACHHQKVVVIDDELVYWGGMDVALGRWDFRHHHVVNRNRADPGGLPDPDHMTHFGPYHDIQGVLAGPAVAAFAELVRSRWLATCPDVIPPAFVPRAGGGVPPSWPDSDPPDFFNVDLAIARTMPAMRDDTPQTEEVIHALTGEIATAEKFIYIENQFLASPEIARALNKRLLERPALRVLLISCQEPQGHIERRAMWGGRLRFKELIEIGGVAGRVVMAHPASRENGVETPVRIHSKLMIVDDKYLHLGSTNLNNRSMGMDTECDVTLMGHDEASRQKIQAVRNDLIREHTGLEVKDIRRIIEQGGSVRNFLEPLETSRQCLREIDDSPYKDDWFVGLCIAGADPRRPPLPISWTRMPKFCHTEGVKNAALWSLAAVALLIALPLAWEYTPLSEYADPHYLAGTFKALRGSPFALVWILAVFVVGGLVFFPVTILSAAVILVFGGFTGFSYAMAGALASAASGYAVGRWMGPGWLQRSFPSLRRAADKLKAQGVLGVTVVRLLPIAPYSLVNIGFGIVRASWIDFMLGTLLGLLPGKVAMALFGDSLLKTIDHPDMASVVQATLLCLVWLGVIMACNKWARKWQSQRAAAGGSGS